MGHNYYCWIETVIQYLDTERNLQSVIEGDQPQKGYNYYSSDPDFEEKRTLNTVIKEYGRKVLFENGTWYCLDAGKIRIQGICYNKKIPFDSLVCVFKFKNGYLL